MTDQDLRSRMWHEMSAVAGDRWPAIRRAVAAGIAYDLLAEMDRPPPASRLHLELRLRVGQFRHQEVA